jgi:hypothetical protein
MGNVHVLLLSVIARWIAEAATTGKYDLSLYPTMGVQPVDNARNHIVEEFLKTDCTHLFFIDSDTIPPMNAITKLLSADKPIVSGLTPIIEHDADRKNDSNGFYRKYNVVGMNEKFVNEFIGLIPVKGAGGSCVLIKREVFEKIPPPWYRFVEDDNGKPIVIGEDIYFTAMAQSVGIQPWADTSIICRHNKPIMW